MRAHHTPKARSGAGPLRYAGGSGSRAVRAGAEVYQGTRATPTGERWCVRLSLTPCPTRARTRETHSHAMLDRLHLGETCGPPARYPTCARVPRAHADTLASMSHTTEKGSLRDVADMKKVCSGGAAAASAASAARPTTRPRVRLHDPIRLARGAATACAHPHPTQSGSRAGPRTACAHPHLKVPGSISGAHVEFSNSHISRGSVRLLVSPMFTLLYLLYFTFSYTPLGFHSATS